ncbi:MAG: MFS transporter [Bacteroidales bacterium]|jgi:fucose permease|nr:MFS transporter [Bacteroidales bacterium]OQB60347.1 MAG: Multidrug resistance protein D [Bacteroidetes bacterium ADurb.Bin145]HOU02788.1 MFS transporter [Bacteroidales bacterium]HQK68808.1 MFS transporter [Bacteroidales bacterium]
MKKTTALVALMAVFSLAICFIILGSISSELMAALGINEAQLGSLVMVAFLTMCIVQLFIGPMVDKFGYKPIAIFGFTITSVSLLLLAVASSFSIALVACILIGFGAMALNTVGNTLIPVVLFEGKDPARASNLGNGFFGMGYVLTPLVIILIIKTMGLSYKVALIVLAILCALFLIFVFTASFPKVQIGFTFAKASQVAVKPAVLIAALALFCYMALEISMGTWVKSLMQELFGASGNADASTKAGLVLSLFGVALMVGRFIVSGVKNLTAMGSKLITFSSLLALIAILLMIIAKGPALGIFAVMLAGLAFAPIFPTIVGVTFAKFDPSLYGSILGVTFSIGLLGGTLVPKFIGNLSVGSTVQQSLLIPAIMAAILLIISLFIGRIGKQK